MRTLIYMLLFGFSLTGCTGDEKVQEKPATVTQPDQSVIQVTPAFPMPRMEDLPPVMVGPDGMRDIAPRLEWLITHHPDVSTRDRLLRDIQSQRILVNVMDDPTLIAQFDPGHNARTGELMGRMLVSGARIDNIHVPGDIIYWWLVLTHEYRHATQYFGATGQERDFWMNGYSPRPPEWCTFQLRNEADAYRAEAMLMQSWGVNIPQETFLMQYLGDERRFSATIAGNMLRSSAATANPECVTVWQKAVEVGMH